MNMNLKPKSEKLLNEILLSPSLKGSRIFFLQDFLRAYGVSSLEEVDADLLHTFLSYTKTFFFGEPSKYSAYKGDLETAYYSYQKEAGNPLTLVFPYANSPIGRKCLTYLCALRIKDFSEITADTRKTYEGYLSQSVSAKKKEYLKVLDKMVLSEIKKITIKRDIRYENDLLYLGYFPDIAIAERFYYTADKEYLYFDFSMQAPVTIKKQIFSLLLSDISRFGEYTNHYMLQHFLIPLLYLYNFCIYWGIQDIKQVSDKDADAFYRYLSENLPFKKKTASQVLYRARKHLFLLDKKPDFTATLWALERFTLTERRNPARGIDCFTFSDVSEENRIYFQHFMRYLLVLSPKYSLQTILEKYYSAKEFIAFIEKRGSSLSEISYADIEEYLRYKDRQDNTPDCYNRDLTMLSFFLTVLSVREKLFIPSFPFEYFYKKTFYRHLDRSVPEKQIDRIFSVLPDFPETIGLMFLVLYSTGLRITEVCTLKKGCVFTEKGEDWLSVYQYKMRSEKQIPLPHETARLLRRHMDASPSEYVFPSCKDPSKPYQVETFTKQIKAQLLLYEETKDIQFKSHDYRHTIATDLHNSGASLSATRAFLGHTRDDMTKHYIDHLPGRIEKMQDEYFKENTLDETIL